MSENGYERSRLDSLCQQFGLIRDSHSALNDVRILQKVFDIQHVHSQHMCTFERPIPIVKVYK